MIPDILLANQREEALTKIRSECQKRTLQALPAPADVTNSAAVQALADRAIESFGRIDVWVSNAAVSVVARFEDTPAEAMRHVIEANLMGYIDGARAALRYFREQDSGVLINVSLASRFWSTALCQRICHDKVCNPRADGLPSPRISEVGYSHLHGATGFCRYSSLPSV